MSAYVGNHSVGLMILGDTNQAVPNLLSQNLSVNARRPIPNFTTIEKPCRCGFGSYNALQVKLEKRYYGGLYFLNSFTWSKAIDNASGHLETTTAITRGSISAIALRNAAFRATISPSTTPRRSSMTCRSAKGAGSICSNRALDMIAGRMGRQSDQHGLPPACR